MSLTINTATTGYPRKPPRSVPNPGVPPSTQSVISVSTVSSDYAINGASSSQGAIRSADMESSSSQNVKGQLEVEDPGKINAFVASREKLKTCFRSYQTLPPKTRQTLKIAGIGLISILAIIAIFYLSRVSEHENGSTGETVIMHHEVEIEMKPGREELEADAEHEMNHKYKVMKDENGKAKQYDVYPQRRFPKFPNLNIDRVRGLRQNWYKANATDVKKTLERVQLNVDADRKMISSKDLRLWEPGDEPLRVLLVSTWRSGSTFLGQLLQSHPGVFQHHEPLQYVGVRQIRSGKEAFQAQQVLHRLLDCKYDGLDEYLNYTKYNALDMIGHNKRVWQSCKEGPNERACVEPDFLSKACKMFPIQLVKTLRVRLNLTQLLLNDENLRVKVLFLVRDPRGIMSSRYASVSWCEQSKECMSPSLLCQDMQDDLKVAAAFEKLYPNRFLKVKYEELVEDLEGQVKKILTFLGMEFSESVKQFLVESTTKDIDAPWSVHRKSSDRVAIWKKLLPLQEIHAVQDACASVLKSLKYEILGS